MKEVRIKRGRWFRLWLSLKDNEKKALEKWLQINNKYELLNALNVLKKHIEQGGETNISEGKILKKMLPKLTNPYQIIQKLYNETLLIVLLKNADNNSNTHLLLRLVGSFVLAHRGLIRDNFTLITQIENESVFKNLIYVCILAITLKSFIYSDFSTEGLMDNREALGFFQYVSELHEMNQNLVKSMIARGLLNKIYNSEKGVNNNKELLNVIMVHINKVAEYIETKVSNNNKYPLFSFVLIMSMFDVFFYLLHDLRKASDYLKYAEPLSKFYPVNAAYPYARMAWAIRLARLSIKTGNSKLLEQSIGIINENKVSARQKRSTEHIILIYQMLFVAYLNIFSGEYNQALVSIKKGVDHIRKLSSDLINSRIVKQLFSDLYLVEIYTYMKLRDFKTAYELICSITSDDCFLSNKFPFKHAAIMMKAIIAMQNNSLSVNETLKELNKVFGETLCNPNLGSLFVNPSYKDVMAILKESIQDHPELIDVMELSNPLTLFFDVPETIARKWYASFLLVQL